jgi:hypothetical protein
VDADDLILLAPNREVLQRMLAICERYGKEHNLVFSTDPVPKLSKTKFVYFCGRTNNVKYPSPVQLSGQDLPWVEQGDHLDHTLHQSVAVDMDCHQARVKFIAKSVDTREQFFFAKPEQKFKMIQILCCDGYGSMLWNLKANPAEQYFKCWNTCVKLVFGVPRSTFTYLVEGFFVENQTSLRNQMLSRHLHLAVVLSKQGSESPGKDGDCRPRSTTCRNLSYMREVTGMANAEWYSSWPVMDSLPVQKVPEKERWRVRLLNSLLRMQSEKYLMVQDYKRICAMIDSTQMIFLSSSIG